MLMAAALVEALRQEVTKALDTLDENDEDQHHREHDVGHEALITETNAEIAQAAAAYGTDHGRITDQADDSECQGKRDPWKGFGQEDLEHDLHRRRTHCTGSFNQALIHAAYGAFDHAGDERRR